jgi:hypothetical protein
MLALHVTLKVAPEAKSSLAALKFRKTTFEVTKVGLVVLATPSINKRVQIFLVVGDLLEFVLLVV